MESITTNLRSSDAEVEEATKLTYTFTFQPLEMNLKKLLRRVTGTNDTSNVTELKLKVFSGQAGLDRLSRYTPLLTTLVLDGSCVNSLRELGSTMKKLTTLSVSRCNLRHLDGVLGFRRLETLRVADNFVTDPSPCSGLRYLNTLDLSGNRISNVSYFAFFRPCPRLETLSIFGNRFNDYQRDVESYLPQLKLLDGQLIDRRTKGSSDIIDGEEQSSEEERAILAILNENFNDV